MVNRLRGDEQAQPDELGNDPGQVGPDSAGQSGDTQQLSSIANASDESVQELADSDQAIEAGLVDGVEDAADHPERPVTLTWSTVVRTTYHRGTTRMTRMGKRFVTIVSVPAAKLTSKT